MASSELPPAIDRMTLVRTITGLSPSNLARVVALIDGAATHISRYGTVPEQAADLIRWAESPAGPGLEAVQKALEQLTPSPLVASTNDQIYISMSVIFWTCVGTGTTLLVIISILIFKYFYTARDVGKLGGDDVPGHRTPAGPDSYPKVDADHPQRPIDTEKCTFTIFNETGEPIRFWRFIPVIPELKPGTQLPPLGKQEMPGTWRSILLSDRENPPKVATAGWSYITVERCSETLQRDSRDRNSAAPDSADNDSPIDTYDKGWVYFKNKSILIIHISKTFFNDSPEDKRLGFSITNTDALE
jgi:hypothetical protein